MRLANRIAVVTGSDSGIGQAIAAELAAKGAHVIVNCLEDEAGAQETLRRITASGAGASSCRPTSATRVRRGASSDRRRKP